MVKQVLKSQRRQTFWNGGSITYGNGKTLSALLASICSIRRFRAEPFKFLYIKFRISLIPEKEYIFLASACFVSIHWLGYCYPNHASRYIWLCTKYIYILKILLLLYGLVRMKFNLGIHLNIYFRKSWAAIRCLTFISS